MALTVAANRTPALIAQPALQGGCLVEGIQPLACGIAIIDFLADNSTIDSQRLTNVPRTNRPTLQSTSIPLVPCCKRNKREEKK